MSARLGILGATGAVGQELLALLEERRTFELGGLRLFASERSAGAKLKISGRRCVVEDVATADFRGLDVLVLSAGRERARRFAPAAMTAGCFVVDNSSAFRSDASIPLVVPEVNGDLLDARPRLVANPNCSTIINSLAVAPIARRYGLKAMSVASYQAASGAGARGLAELRDQLRAHQAGEEPVAEVFPEPLVMNVLPQIGPLDPAGVSEEEAKMQAESRRLLDLPDLLVQATCARVPVERSHSLAVHLETEVKVEVEELRALLSAAAGVVLDELPTPGKAAGRDEILVGRVRVHPEDSRRLSLFVCGDQLRKGAALNALQIAERLVGRAESREVLHDPAVPATVIRPGDDTSWSCGALTPLRGGLHYASQGRSSVAAPSPRVFIARRSEAQGSRGPGESPMDLQELEELINLMNENGLSLLEVEEEGKHYRLEKGTLAPAPMMPAPMPAVAPIVASAPDASSAAAEPARGDNTITFNSPMVGTFYRASSPEHEPFARPGERVDAETVICIIEAMKVFNEIKAEMSGTIVEVLAENAEAVEYGQPLFLIRPD